MRRVSEIAEGNTGVYQTVAKMLRLLTRPSSRADQIARRIRLEHPGANAYTLAAAVHAFVLGHMQYVHDDPSIEELFEPELLLAQLENRGVMQGDCDDYVMITAALLKRLGVRYEIVLASSRDDGQYDHVYTRAITEYGAISMDAIYGEAFGWEHHGFTATESLPS